MNIMLVGGRQKANFLTKSLMAKRHSVTIVNNDYEWCKLLSNTHDATCIHGDGTKPFILEDADVRHMDTVIALSNKDSTNLVVCEIAKKQFGVKNTIAVVNDPKNVQLFKSLGVSKCISATQMITEIIEQEAVIHELASYLPLEGGRVIVCELNLDDTSPGTGKKLWELALPENSIIGCIIRGDETIVPKGNTTLHAGDRVILLASNEMLKQATALLAGR